MKSFVIGDIHGNHKALKQVFERSGFDKDVDKLVVLGDVCDGFPFVKQCFNELLSIRNMIYLIGNHDVWALDWYTKKMGVVPLPLWTKQGGENTLKSYGYEPMDKEHLYLLEVKARNYYTDGKKLFVHAGIDECVPIKDHTREFLTWDRTMINKAIMVHPVNPDYKFGEWEQIFIGHTTTQALLRITTPLRVCNVIDMDTGGGWSGKVTIMDYSTGEFWQSNPSTELYPNTQTRG